MQSQQTRRNLWLYLHALRDKCAFNQKSIVFFWRIIACIIRIFLFIHIWIKFNESKAFRNSNKIYYKTFVECNISLQTSRKKIINFSRSYWYDKIWKKNFCLRYLYNLTKKIIKNTFIAMKWFVLLNLFFFISKLLILKLVFSKYQYVLFVFDVAFVR